MEYLGQSIVKESSSRHSNRQREAFVAGGVCRTGDPRFTSAFNDTSWIRQRVVPRGDQTRGRKLREIIYAEPLLDAGDLIDNLVETFFAEELMFFRLEFFAKRVELVLRQNTAKRGEQHRVLAGLMWLVHPNELLHGFDDRLCRGGIFECLGVRQLCDSVG